MSIVIGATSTVSFDNGDCVVSVNWGYNPNVQRLYCLGAWDVFATIEKPTETLNITIYSPGDSFVIDPTGACANASTIGASVNPTVCGDPVDGVSGAWFLTSYGYNKDDPVGPGQETWSMTKWVAGDDTPVPTYVIRGISDGQSSVPTSNTGVVFDADSIKDGTSGSVSAGSVGKAFVTRTGMVTAVGGGTNAGGEVGTASVSIPYTPLWL